MRARRKDVDACADLWGGRVVMGKEELNAKTPVAPIDMTKDLSCPLIGLFGNDDRAPSPEQVNQHEAELKKHGKAYEFHRYDGAGHGFFYWHRPIYRPEQAMDGWSKLFAFFGKHLGEIRSAKMCTSIIEIARAEGMAKRGDEWFPLTQAVVAYDHARHAPLGDVITLDFINAQLEPGARAGIELTLETRQRAARRARPGDCRGRIRGGGSARQGRGASLVRAA